MNTVSEQVLDTYVRHMYIISCGLIGIRVQDLPEDVRVYYALYLSYRDELRSKYYVPRLDYNICQLNPFNPIGTCLHSRMSILLYEASTGVSTFAGPMTMEQINVLHNSVIAALYIAVKDSTTVLHPTVMRIIHLYANSMNTSIGTLDTLKTMSKKSNKDAKLYMNNTTDVNEALLFLKSL